MFNFKLILTIPLSISSFILTVYSVGKLMQFLSTPKVNNDARLLFESLLDDYSRLEIALFSLTIDLILVILFILQHSIMRSQFVKQFWNIIGLKTAERSFYNLITSYTLLYLIKNWKTCNEFTLWKIDVEKTSLFWWTFITIHVISWIIIYGGSIIMDLPELLGLKQVYYDMNKLQTPMLNKSKGLKQLYGHIRHPSFFGLTLILWSSNIMSLDRFILAIMWTMYMYLAWNTDEQDVNYQKTQLFRKKYELTKRI